MRPLPHHGSARAALVVFATIALLAALLLLGSSERAWAVSAASLLVGGVAAGVGWERARAKALGAPAAAERAHAEASSRTVLDAATDVAILATDRDGTVQLFSAGAERLLGLRERDALGRAAWVDWLDPAELEARCAELSGADRPRVSRFEALFGSAHHGIPREWTLVRPDGERRAICLVTTAWLDAAGAPRGLVTVAHDATMRHASESTLREAMRAAESANEAKTRFLANTSHEIRTPMNAVLGLVYLLEHTRLDDDQRGLVDKINTASNALLGLLSDILDIGKLEANELILERAPFDLHQLVRERTGAHLGEASAKGVGLEVRIDPRVASAVEADPGRVGQIVTNLVSNAVKFTESGRVIVELKCGGEREHDSAREVSIQLEVRDTGIGMSREALERVFSPFAQADASTTRRHGGTGLGLTIVQRLARLMGGEVEIDSEPELGTEVRVALRLERCASASASASASTPTRGVVSPVGKALAGLTILVVDDSETNRVVADHVLRLHGAEVCLAENGLEAVELLRLRPHVDAVLMDVHMPVIDGPEAAFVTRTELGLGPDVLPIIALTAGTLSSERERALGAGMNDFLTKPIVPQTLIATLLRHVRRAESAPTEGSGTKTTASMPPRSGVRGIEGIDAKDLHERLGDDSVLVLTLLAHFRDETFGIRWPMGELDATSLEAHRADMHRLKGSAATVGAVEVAQRASALELACKRGDVEQVRALGTELRTRLEALRDAIGRATEPGSEGSVAEVAPRSAA
ncbi:MAG: ATP-binding protein [Sandaracinus sp.]